MINISHLYHFLHLLDAVHVSFGLKLISTGSASGLIEGLLYEVTRSEVSDCQVTTWEGTDCEDCL